MKFIKNLSVLDWVFTLELLIFGLIITGILPRSAALFLGAGLAIYTLAASLENATILFVRSIPVFLALPLTDTFDNFNTWRILSGIIFLKFLISKSEFLKKPKIPRSKTAISLYLLAIFMMLSV